jgi:hypothetical protein
MAETLPNSHTESSDEIVIHVAPGFWEVIEVQPGPDDGKPAGIRGWRGPGNPIWAVTLVLRSLG